jgi:hypothetical protein
MLHENQQKNDPFVTINTPRYIGFVTIYALNVCIFYYFNIYDCKRRNNKNNYTIESIYAHNFQFQQIKNC